MVKKYQSNPGQERWTAVKHIIKHLKRTRDYMLLYKADSLVSLGYTDSDFQSSKDSRKFTSSYVFTLGSGAISWRSIKQSCIADSTMEAEYVAAKEAVWLRNFLLDLRMVLSMQLPITLYCDNSGAVANSKEPRAHKKGKHIERKYHLIRDIVQRGDVGHHGFKSKWEIVRTIYTKSHFIVMDVHFILIKFYYFISMRIYMSYLCI